MKIDSWYSGTTQRALMKHEIEKPERIIQSIRLPCKSIPVMRDEWFVLENTSHDCSQTADSLSIS